MGSARADLEIEVITPHRQPVSGAVVRLAGAETEQLGIEDAPGRYRASLPEAGRYDLVVTRGDEPGGFRHRTVESTLLYSRVGAGAALIAAPAPAVVPRQVWGIQRDGDLHRVTVILDYQWFTPIGYPPTLGDHVDVLIGGEEAWGAVAEAMAQAQRFIHVTTWQYDATAELLRPSPLADALDRARFAAHNVLEARAEAGVTVRLLLWDAPFLRLPRHLRLAGETQSDGFEVMEEENPTRRALRAALRFTRPCFAGLRIGSYHQKTITIDGRLGFCGGMNLREVDWDSREHRVFDARRCSFARPVGFRSEVAAGARRPDHPPRHDLMVRLEGPSLQHLEENFHERWNRLIDMKSGYAVQATPMAAPAPRPPGGASQQVQVVRTMPAPLAERGILDVYRRAVGSARRLIYIEDQFFRSTYVSLAIAEAARANPGLAVVVLTNRSQADGIFTAGWSRQGFDRIARELPGFELHGLQAAGVDHRGKRHLEEVYIHAKLLIVDDEFALVGSCNANDRGFEFEGEIDLAIADRDLISRLRVDLWRGHLGADARVTGEITSDVAVWKERAARNRAYDPAGDAAPAGFVFPFVPPARARTFFAPDVF